MYLGRFTLGEFVPIAVHCHDAEIAFAPPTAPVFDVYDSAGDKIVSGSLPPLDLGAITGLFAFGLYLGTSMAIGHYSVIESYSANSIAHMAVSHFEIVAGGNVYGTVISQAFFDRPHAKFLVQKMDSQNRRLIKNPRGT
jgi:hypothetical protein